MVTSVDRDDLADGGAEHFAQTIRAIRARCPTTTIEILTPDFLRKEGALEVVAAAKPDVFNHNLETVPARYLTVRPGARYFHSIRLLQRVKEIDPTIFTKSGIMVGLGEERHEVLQVMDDLRSAEVDFLTIGQYLQPTRKHHAVMRYVTPDEFAGYEKVAYTKGFLMVSASPLTRSSHHAGEDFARLQAARVARSPLALGSNRCNAFWSWDRRGPASRHLLDGCRRSTGIPFVSLDALYWKPGWVASDNAEFGTRVAEVARQPQWVMDGNYTSHGAGELRRQTSDTVIWFDLPRRSCMLGIMRRIAGSYGRVRPEMAEGCPEQFDFEFFRYVWTYRRQQRPKLLDYFRRTARRSIAGLLHRPDAGERLSRTHRAEAEPGEYALMPRFSSKRRVHHTASQMFDLVADVERYPEFVPLCQSLKIRQRTPKDDGTEIIVADMTVSFKLVRETFTSRVTLDRPNLKILVEYLKGPFSNLENRWTFEPSSETDCDVGFFLSYEFKSRMLAMLMGTMFDTAFQRFAAAFEKRADAVYGKGGTVSGKVS